MKSPALKSSVMAQKCKRSVVTKNYPYVVKVAAPRGAWCDLGNMHEFHVRNGIAEMRCQIFDDNAVVHRRFEEPAYAEFFIAEFGGELLPSLPTSDLAMMRVSGPSRLKIQYRSRGHTTFGKSGQRTPQ